MSLIADQRDYKNAFNKHYHAIKNWNGTGSDISRRLILVYAVECGLKYIVMNRGGWKCIEDIADEDMRKILRSHDFRELLKAIHWAGSYSFSCFKTKHKDTVEPKSFHQICRYSISPESHSDIQNYENQLCCIAENLEEAVRNG